MNDFDGFERRLASAIIADADEAIPGFDPISVSRAATAHDRRPRGRLRAGLARAPRMSPWRRRAFAPIGGAWAVMAATAGLAVVIVASIAALQGPWSGAPSSSPSAASPVASAGVVTTARGAWSFAASMGGARADGLVAVVLLDGRVLVLGGAEDPRSAELYDPESGTWTSTGSTVEPRVRATATLLRGGRVLLTGGSDARSVRVSGDAVTFPVTLASAEVYDPAVGTWTAAGSMSQARSGHTATLLEDGRVLIAGGAAPQRVAFRRFDSTEIYDAAAGSWTVGPAMHGARDSHTATLLPSGIVLVAGGHDSNRLRFSELFNPATNTWVAASDLPEAFLGHKAALLPTGAVLVAGGDVPRGPGAAGSAHAAAYDPASDTWAMTAGMVTPRIGHEMTVLPDGDILVTGGAALGAPDPNPYASTEIFDAATGTWALAAPMSVARSGHAAVLLPDGRVLVIGGSGIGDVPLASAELFQP